MERCKTTRVSSMLSQELGQEILRSNGLGLFIHGSGSSSSSLRGNLALANSLLRITQHVRPPRALRPSKVILKPEQVPMQGGVNPDERRIAQVFLEGGDHTADIVAAVQKPETLPVGDHADDVEGVALEPVAHVEPLPYGLRHRRRHLLEPLREQVRALVHERLVVHERRHGVRGLVELPVLRVARDRLVAEDAPLARAGPRRVPGGFREVAPVAVDRLRRPRVVYAVPVWAVADDWACGSRFSSWVTYLQIKYRGAMLSTVSLV